jgi:hypothetical protein
LSFNEDFAIYAYVVPVEDSTYFSQVTLKAAKEAMIYIRPMLIPEWFGHWITIIPE